MRFYKFNSLVTFLFSVLAIGLVVFLPIALIETLWNTTIGRTSTDLTINFWQALILWLIILTILNISGIFRFEFALETVDPFDKEKKLEAFQSKTREKSEVDKKETNKETKE